MQCAATRSPRVVVTTGAGYLHCTVKSNDVHEVVDKGRKTFLVRLKTCDG